MTLTINLMFRSFFKLKHYTHRIIIASKILGLNVTESSMNSYNASVSPYKMTVYKMSRNLTESVPGIFSSQNLTDNLTGQSYYFTPESYKVFIS